MRVPRIRPLSFFFCALLPACGAAPGPDAFDGDTLVAIAADALPPARTGVEYRAHVSARGPNPPLTWRVAGGRLPRGLSLDAGTGEVAGWPRDVGLHRFVVEVRDGLDPRIAHDVTVAAAVRSFALDVERGPVALLPLVVPWMQFAAPYAFAVEATGGTPPYRFEAAGGDGV